MDYQTDSVNGVVNGTGGDDKKAKATSKPKPRASSDVPNVLLTVITNSNGPIAKEFWLEEDGKLGKKSAAQVWDGTAEVVTVNGLAGVSDLIRGLKPNLALVYGVPTLEKARLVTVKQLRAGELPPDAIARTNDEFTFPMGKPGVLMGDYDPRPGHPPLATWTRSCAGSCRATRASSASGRQARPRASAGSTPVTFCRAPEDGGFTFSSITRPTSRNVGDYIFQALFAAGYGYCDVSKSGQVLIRTIRDGAVWQASRIDFATQPVLAKGLKRFAPDPVMIDGAPVMDTTKLQPKMSMAKWREDKDNAALRKARAAVKGEVKRKRAAYIAEREAALRAKDLTDEEVRRKTGALSRAMKERVLTADAELLCSDGKTLATVRDLLADPERWHQEHFADPLEPDYRDDNRIAIAYLTNEDGRPPVIHSFAHGGATFTLLPDPEPEPAEARDTRPAYEIQGCYMVVRRRVPGMPVPGVLLPATGGRDHRDSARAGVDQHPHRAGCGGPRRGQREVGRPPRGRRRRRCSTSCDDRTRRRSDGR